MGVISLFDPWKSKLCTCPKKYSFSPYTGCEHGCVYCYASSYVYRFFECRPKQDVVKRLWMEVRRIDKDVVISIANSSDPYPPMERKLKITRSCLSLLFSQGCRVLLITKSNLVTRDLDLLRDSKVCVSFTVTTLDEKLAKRLESNAPPPKKRLDAAQTLVENGIPVAIRLDPIIPFLNDGEIEELVKSFKEVGASHVVSSTFKPRLDGWKRFSRAFPEEAERLRELYFKKGKKVSNSFYLPREMRLELMERVRKACDREGLTFACCREGFPELHTGRSCDGSHLVPG